MPLKPHAGKVVRVRTKTLKDGTKIRVYIYTKKGPRGGRTTGERVKKSNGKAK